MPVARQPVSIRRSLLTNLALLVLTLATALLTISLVSERITIRRLSSTIITATLDQAEVRLDTYFTPVSNELRLVRDWCQTGLITLDEPDRVDELLAPVIERNPLVSSVIIARRDGREQMLMRTDRGWLRRRTDPEEWGDLASVTEWAIGSEPGGTEESWTPLDPPYDARTRLWFINAAKAGVTDVVWTDVYAFFTSGKPGISASVPVRTPDGVDLIIAFDLALTDISQVSMQARIATNGRMLITTADGRVVGLPRGQAALDEAARDALLLTPVAELGGVESDAVAALQDHSADLELTEPLRFRSDGRVWWGFKRPFVLSEGRSFDVGVMVPEHDLLGHIKVFQVQLAAAVLIALAVGVWRIVVLSRRYGIPLEALADQSDAISRLQLEHPVSVDRSVLEVHRLSEAHERMRASLQSLLKLEQDLQVARRIQLNTLPRSIPKINGFQVAAFSEPADETGGDTYDVIGLALDRSGRPAVVKEDAEQLVLLLADATGHGIGPALSVTQLRAMLRMAIRAGDPPDEVLRHINAQLCDDLPGGRFITAWLALIDGASRRVDCFSAGHGPILIIGADGEVRELKVDAPPLGVADPLEVTFREGVKLTVGDSLIVLSDGFFEALHPEHGLFGRERGIAALSEARTGHPDRMIASLRASVDAFLDGHSPNDDRTAIVVRRIS